MKRFKSISLSACAVFVAVFMIAPTPSASAASASLSIIPKKNYTIESGKTVNDRLVIRNLDAEQSLDLTLRVVDFTYNDDGGSPKLLLAEDEPQTTWSLKPYLKVPKTVSIPANGSKTLDMSIGIPKEVGAGSYYSAIVYSSGAPEGGNVGLSASGVTLVFSSVPGEVDEKLTLDKFGAYKLATSSEAGKYQFITMQEPQLMAYTLKNEGNVTESPVGSITVKHMFGKEINITDVNPNSSLALIGQTRTFTACMKLKAEDIDFNGSRSEARTCDSPGLWPGRYTASVNLFYGQNGNRTQDIVGTGSFWYLPAWFLITLFVVILAIAFGIWRLVRKFQPKSYSARPRTPGRRR